MDHATSSLVIPRNLRSKLDRITLAGETMIEYREDAHIVIVAYRPKPGKEADLLQLTREHVPLLRAEGLATDRPLIACQAKDGTIVEVFEWAAGGVLRAHSNPAVHALWTRYADACDFVPLTSLAEASTMFASFTSIDLS